MGKSTVFSDADELRVPEEPKGPTRIVFIRAESIRAFGGGLFAIEVPARTLEPDEHKMLDQLFPNTQLRIEELLSTEALISAQEMPNGALTVRNNIDRDGCIKFKY